MSTYDLAVLFWSTVAAVAVVAPFAAVAVREAIRAIEHLHDHPEDSHPSLVSVPSVPRPSSPG